MMRVAHQQLPDPNCQNNHCGCIYAAVPYTRVQTDMCYMNFILTCGSQRIMTMEGLKLLIILTESQRRMAMTANKFCQYQVILHDHLSISE